MADRAIITVLEEIGREFEDAAARRQSVTFEPGLVALFALALRDIRANVEAVEHRLDQGLRDKAQLLAERQVLADRFAHLEAAVQYLVEDAAEEAAIVARRRQIEAPGATVIDWPLVPRPTARVVPITDGSAPC